MLTVMNPLYYKTQHLPEGQRVALWLRRQTITWLNSSWVHVHACLKSEERRTRDYSVAIPAVGDFSHAPPLPPWRTHKPHGKNLKKNPPKTPSHTQKMVLYRIPTTRWHWFNSAVFYLDVTTGKLQISMFLSFFSGKCKHFKNSWTLKWNTECTSLSVKLKGQVITGARPQQAGTWKCASLLCTKG